MRQIPNWSEEIERRNMCFRHKTQFFQNISVRLGTQTASQVKNLQNQQIYSKRAAGRKPVGHLDSARRIGATRKKMNIKFINQFITKQKNTHTRPPYAPEWMKNVAFFNLPANIHITFQCASRKSRALYTYCRVCFWPWIGSKLVETCFKTLCHCIRAAIEIDALNAK